MEIRKEEEEEETKKKRERRKKVGKKTRDNYFHSIKGVERSSNSLET